MGSGSSPPLWSVIEPAKRSCSSRRTAESVVAGWLGVETRWLLNTDETAPVHGLRRDDFVTLRLSRYF